MKTVITLLIFSFSTGALAEDRRLENCNYKLRQFAENAAEVRSHYEPIAKLLSANKLPAQQALTKAQTDFEAIVQASATNLETMKYYLKENQPFNDEAISRLYQEINSRVRDRAQDMGRGESGSSHYKNFDVGGLKFQTGSSFEIFASNQQPYVVIKTYTTFYNGPSPKTYESIGMKIINLKTGQEVQAAGEAKKAQIKELFTEWHRDAQPLYVESRTDTAEIAACRAYVGNYNKL